MKQFIVLMSMIALGLFLYNYIAGPEDSVMSSLKLLWRHEILASPYGGAS